MQEDGYLAVYTYYRYKQGRHKANTTWKADANSIQGEKAVYKMSNDLVVLDSSGIEVWSTKTIMVDSCTASPNGFIEVRDGTAKIINNSCARVILNADDLPLGSWLTSCYNKSASGGIATASCYYQYGIFQISISRETSLNYKEDCAEGSTISNVDGSLRCDKWGAGLPSGSYNSSCPNNLSYKGGILSAACSEKGRGQEQASLNYKEDCADGSTVSYDHGELLCDTLLSTAAQNYGKEWCADDSGVSNINGKLRCSRYVPNEWVDIPILGSYKWSCKYPSYKDGILSAACSEKGRGQEQASLNYKEDCAEGSTVSNINGKLRCDTRMRKNVHKFD